MKEQPKFYIDTGTSEECQKTVTAKDMGMRNTNEEEIDQRTE